MFGKIKGKLEDLRNRPVDVLAHLFLIASVVSSVVIVALSLAVSEARGAQGDTPVVDAVVVAYRCDGARGVNNLQLLVPTPGVVVVQWDNVKACGKAV